MLSKTVLPTALKPPRKDLCARHCLGKNKQSWADPQNGKGNRLKMDVAVRTIRWTTRASAGGAGSRDVMGGLPCSSVLLLFVYEADTQIVIGGPSGPMMVCSSDRARWSRLWHCTGRVCVHACAQVVWSYTPSADADGPLVGAMHEA